MRCPRCRHWSTFEPVSLTDKTSDRSFDLAEIERDPVTRCPTGLAWFDTLINGGLVSGCAYLLAGDPGGGKSTLASQFAKAFDRVLWVSGEESCAEVAARMHRLRIKHSGFRVREAWDLEAAIAEEDDDPDLIVADSAHTFAMRGIGGAPGSVGQVQAIAHYFMHECRDRRIPGILIAHVNKDGDLSGPNAARHLVTCPLIMSTESDQTRTLSVEKNRHGPAPVSFGGLVLTRWGLITSQEYKEREKKKDAKKKERETEESSKAKKGRRAPSEQTEKGHEKSKRAPKARNDRASSAEKGLELGPLDPPPRSLKDWPS